MNRALFAISGCIGCGWFRTTAYSTYSDVWCSVRARLCVFACVRMRTYVSRMFDVYVCQKNPINMANEAYILTYLTDIHLSHIRIAYVCMYSLYTCVHVFSYIRSYVCACGLKHTFIRVCVRPHIYALILVCVCSHIYETIRVYVCTCVRVFPHMRPSDTVTSSAGCSAANLHLELKSLVGVCLLTHICVQVCAFWEDANYVCVREWCLCSWIMSVFVNYVCVQVCAFWEDANYVFFESAHSRWETTFHLLFLRTHYGLETTF